MKRKSRRRVLIVVAAVLILVVAAAALSARRSSGGVYTEEIVKTQDISTHLSFSGHIRAADEKQQLAQKSMKVRELYVEEEDRVEAGALLFRASDGERVYADIAGTIERLYIEKDGQLSPGAPIADIIDYGTLIARVDADEYDVGALSVGQDMTIYVNALGVSVEGRITKIANDATVGKDVSYYTVEAALTDAAGLRAGMSVEGQVLKAHAAQVTTISMNALQFDLENQPFVYMRDANGHVAAAYVSVGINDGVRVEITSGPQPGDTVFIPVRGMAMMPMGPMGR